MKVVVVIPAFNEAVSIGHVVKEVRAQYPAVVVVDDASDDKTGVIAERQGAIVLCHLINRGQGAALKTGIMYALQEQADVVVTFDADGQHQVDDIKKLIEPIIAGTTDVTLGSRFLTSAVVNMPTLRKAVLKLAVIFTRAVSGLSISDTHNGLRAFSRMALSKIKLHQDRMAHASEILDEINRNRLRYYEVPVSIRYTDYSKAKGQSSLAAAKILFKYFIGKLMR